MLLVLLCFISTVNAQDGSYSRLYNSIINNSSRYNRFSPPWEQGTKVNATVGNYFMVLIKVEENKQVVTYIAMLNVTWNDPRLVWDPEEIGASSIMVPPGTVWKPILNMYNCLNNKDLKEQWDESTLEVRSHGTVSQLSYSSVETVCSIFVESFPFDEQYCALSFTSVLAPIEDFQILALPDVPVKIGIPEWSVHETMSFHSRFSQVGRNYSLAQIMYRFKRNPEFYIYFLILPTFIVTSLCIAAMLLPIDLGIGERINMGIAGLLSLTFLLSVIIGELPRTPGLPLMGKWVIVEMFFCCGAMIVSMAIGFVVKILIRSRRKIKTAYIEGSIFIIVMVANVTTTLVMFMHPPGTETPKTYNGFKTYD